MLHRKRIHANMTSIFNIVINSAVFIGTINTFLSYHNYLSPGHFNLNDFILMFLYIIGFLKTTKHRYFYYCRMAS